LSSEYDPLFSPRAPGVDDLAAVRAQFSAAGGPYLRFPWSWLAWALLLPAAALLTPRLLAARGAAGVLFGWSAAILLGGAVEIIAIRRAARGVAGSSLASWTLRLQGNMSLVALALSAALVWSDAAWMLPGVWLLLLGHSFYALGGLSFAPFRLYGLLYEAGGLAALWPGGSPLWAFAVTTAVGNLWMAFAVWRAGGAVQVVGSER
jgi:hypothetical protein